MKTLAENRRALKCFGIHVDKTLAPRPWENVVDAVRLGLIGVLVGFVTCLSAGYIFDVTNRNMAQFICDFYTTIGFSLTFGMYYFLLTNQEKLRNAFHHLDFIVNKSKREEPQTKKLLF